MTPLTLNDLRRELSEYREVFPRLSDDELFVVWFLRAFVADNDDQAAAAICGGSRDKSVDAVYIDDPAKIVTIVQGKYRKDVAIKNEKRGDITSFAQLAVSLGNNEEYSSLCEGLSPEVHGRLDEARRRVLKRSYNLQMYYVTMGKCSSSLTDEARRIVRGADIPSSIQIFDGHQVLRLLSDYLDGVAPPVPSLDLEMETGGGIQVKGVLQRYDGKTDIESWVFSMASRSIAALFERAGPRLFARNVRGFLGSTEINQGMEATLRREPEYFWYYNNGITVICDNAEEVRSRGQNILRVTNPQVINGQQTTRTLSKHADKGLRASVLVRVIRVPRNNDSHSSRFESLVSQIVSATNWQNAIRPSDLMSNDRRQIEIERQFRKIGYWYVRKRQTKSEAKRSAGSQRYFMIRKDDLAQAVAGCELDPAILREGKERLFEERWYSQVFPTADPNFYLSRYRLMREVSYAARRFPERAYAKWLVLNFTWNKLAPLVRSRAGAEAFRRECERNGPSLYPLNRAVDTTYKAALRFYRLRRGVGERAADVSTFFKRRALHTEFSKFWRGSTNKSRPLFTRTWKQFEEALREEIQR